ncbi:MAG TPA: HAD family hydrolase [Steroidobacteraceae bacterium]|nr:HAD family hydrolase [Steroidobacteraceae bacterium]
MGSGPKAVQFDLDDTLTDRRASLVKYARDFQLAFHEDLHAVSETHLLRVMIAADASGYAAREELFAALRTQLPWGSVPPLRTLAQHWESGFPPATVAREGALEALLTLRERGILLGIVTNGHIRIQRPKIEHLGLAQRVDCVVISEEVGYHKPDVRVFERALPALGCVGPEAWFVGDHPRNDIVGAAAAGLKPIWLTGIHPWPGELPQPERSIDSLADLLELAASGTCTLRES